MQDPDLELEIAIKQLILLSAPERAMELEDLWKTYSPRLLETGDKPEVTFEAGPFGLVRFTKRTVRQMWILGFAAQTAFLSYGQILIASLVFHEASLDDLQHVDTKSYDTLIGAVRELGRVEKLSDFRWPLEVPDPSKGQPTDTSKAFAFDLHGIAMAYCFLHEIQHLMFCGSSNAPLPSHQEELECDQFARDFLLKNIEEYAETSGYPLPTLQNKRATGIGVASFFLLALTPFENWAGSPSHPALASRLMALTGSLTLPDEDMFWIHLSCLIAAQLRFRRIKITGITSASPKGVCLELIARLPSSTAQGARPS